jgi:acyl-CoA reductase-like NAD-dependent aldehyde dehydrogenase
MPDYMNYINGQFVPAAGADRIDVKNPSTGRTICTVPDSGQMDVDVAIAAADAAQKDWARRPPIQRANLLHALATILRAHVEPLARVIVEEQGKTLGLARVEVVFTADYIDYMAEWARRIEGEIIPSDRPGETIGYANDSEYGLTSSIYTRDLDVALRACQEIRFGETYVNRENFEAMQGFHGGWRKSGIGGADGKHGLYEFTQTHIVYLQRA